MMTGLYIGTFVLSFIMMVLLVYKYWNHASAYYVMLFVSIMVTNFGYMQMAFAKNLQSALFANQVVYLGCSFCPFFMMMCVAHLCKVHIHSLVRLAFVMYSSVLFFFILSVGRETWYYRDVYFLIENGIGRLIRSYGPFHIMYPVFILGNILLEFCFIAHAFLRHKDVSYTTLVSLFAVVLIAVVAYFVEKALHLWVELIPMAYVVGQCVLLYLLRRINLYDVMSVTAESMSGSTSYGFVLFDAKGRYLGSDATAKRWFPEINALRIDGKIREENTVFLQMAGKWIRKETHDKTAWFECGDRYVEAEHSFMQKGSTRVVHCVYLQDITTEHEYTRRMEQYKVDLENDVAEKTDRILQIQNDIIVSMASIVENRDHNTGGHVARTSDVMNIFVKHLLETGACEQLNREIAECIIKAAPLHDFGKIAVPDVILNKPGKFTDEEYAEMKKHSAKGAVIVARILRNSDDIQLKNIAVNVAHFHHEKWDGRGYPEGLRGTEIPFEARMMALADVFDALVSKRVYKEKFDYNKAFSIIEESGGSHFDPELCREFLKCRPEIEALYDSYAD